MRPFIDANHGLKTNKRRKHLCTTNGGGLPLLVISVSLH